MRTHRLEREQVVTAPLPQVFEFFSQARNLEALTPKWLRFQVLTPEPVEMRLDTTIEYRLRLRGIPLRWVSRIEQWEPERRFVDVQVQGPYRFWHHIHEFAPDRRGTRILDLVRYALPFGLFGAAAHIALVHRDLASIFDYRRDAAARLLGAPVPE